ncbi:hypothetical protein [Gaoshiqia sp. Z1-71]|uniref:hypothetical protein n=1 Tax=Gaoshiqia hydrogeniformans TaxID=3290090 RepID=UPI003BF7BF6D
MNTEERILEYKLKKLSDFALGDPKSLEVILVSFLKTGKENMALFRQYLDEKNAMAISGLSHKMLPLFRQLEVKPIVEILDRLAHEDRAKLDDRQFFLLAGTVQKWINKLLLHIEKHEM